MPANRKETFTKKERLISRKEIGRLFEEGNRFTVSPFRVIWGITNEERDFPVKFLVSVPKRNMKKAVDRNLIKRRVKEAYRKQKDELYSVLEGKEQKINLILVYSSSTSEQYEVLYDKISNIIDRLKKAIDQ